MKILYIDLEVIYQAPTRNLVPLVLKNISDLDIYGLGYTSDNILKKGIKEYIQTNGPYDFIITNEHIILNGNKLLDNNNRKNMQEAYRNNFITNFNLENVCDFILDMYYFFIEYKNNKAIILLETDYYNLKSETIQVLIDSNTYIISEGQQFIKLKKDLPYLKYEKFYESTNDNWANFAREYDNRFISLSQFVADTEFSFNTLGNRTNIIEIPGTNYHLRKEAFSCIKKTHYKYSKKRYMIFFKILSKLGFKPYAHKILMRLYQLFFKELINKSKYVYTCGSGLEYPIRKFYEVPALGSLLMATPCSGYEELGFEDKKTFIKVTPNEIIENIKYLEQNPEYAQQIVDNAQKMLWRNHSVNARSKQIKDSFEAILEDRFNGTYWKSGEFFIKEKESIL